MEDVNRIKLVLVEKKRTNKWLSDQMGVTPSTVSKWCTNSSQPDLPSLLKIADLLEVDIKELIVREYKKFLVEQELTKEARAEGKIAYTMPCKEEVGDSLRFPSGTALERGGYRSARTTLASQGDSRKNKEDVEQV